MTNPTNNTKTIKSNDSIKDAGSVKDASVANVEVVASAVSAEDMRAIKEKAQADFVKLYQDNALSDSEREVKVMVAVLDNPELLPDAKTFMALVTGMGDRSLNKNLNTLLGTFIKLNDAESLEPFIEDIKSINENALKSKAGFTYNKYLLSRVKGAINAMVLCSKLSNEVTSLLIDN